MKGKKRLTVFVLLIATLALASNSAAFTHRWNFDDAEKVKTRRDPTVFTGMGIYTKHLFRRSLPAASPSESFS